MTGGNGFAVRDLTVRYADGNTHMTALSHVRIDFPVGGVTAIIGESGSGKSTLGQALFGALPQGAKITGQILFDGVDVTALGQNVLRSRYWGKRWGIVPQLPRAALSPVHRIERQLADVRRGAGRSAWEAAQYEELLARFGFDDPQRVLRSYPHELSGGMLQRVLCAMADAGEPQWILADEPTKGLDPAVWQMVADNLKYLTARTGVSLLLITHDIPLARQLADRVIVMQAGQIVEEGTGVWTKPEHPYTRAYFQAQPAFLAAVQTRAGDPGTIAVREEDSAAAPAPTKESPAVLAASALTKNMRDRASGKEQRVLDGCSLTVAAGDAVGLEGRSGAGKSTLVRILLGLIRPDGGTIQWNGRAIAAFSRAELRAFRRSVQLVAQNPEQAFDPRRRIEESLHEVFAIHPTLLDGERSARAQVMDGLRAVELTERVLKRQPHELSGGELQRAAIARALLTQPRILLLDEPTTMLDVSIQAQIMQLLLQLREERHLGMLLISHDRPLLNYFADAIHILEAGKVR